MREPDEPPIVVGDPDAPEPTDVVAQVSVEGTAKMADAAGVSPMGMEAWGPALRETEAGEPPDAAPEALVAADATEDPAGDAAEADPHAVSLSGEPPAVHAALAEAYGAVLREIEAGEQPVAPLPSNPVTEDPGAVGRGDEGAATRDGRGPAAPDPDARADGPADGGRRNGPVLLEDPAPETPPAAAADPEAPATPAMIPTDPARLEALRQAWRELDVEEPPIEVLAGLPETPPIEQEQPRREPGVFEAEPEEDVPERELPESSPEAALLAIAAILDEEDHERVLLGPSAPAPSLRPRPKATAVEIPPEIIEWFVRRDLDIGAKTEALLRRYMREWDRQRRRKR